MSRILKGGSDQAQSMRAAEVKKAQGVRDVELPKFRLMQAANTLTKAESDTLVEQARVQARKEGFAEAEARLKKPLASAVENLEGVLDELSRFRRELFEEVEEDILGLLQRMAGKILKKELSLQPEVLKDLVGRAIETVDKEREILVLINPTDRMQFQKAKADFLEKFQGVEQVDIQESKEVPQGSALVKTRTREVEVNVEKMVDHLLQQISMGKEKPIETGDDEDKV